MNEQTLLSDSEAAKLLGIGSVNIVKLWCRSGQMQSIYRDGSRMIPASEIERIRDSDLVRTERALDALHAEILDFGPEAGLTDEQLRDLSASRPGRLPWQAEDKE